MKRLTILMTTLVLVVGLMAAPRPVVSAVGVWDSGTDANGVVYSFGWVDGVDNSETYAIYDAGYNWYEAYYDGTNVWASITGIASYTDPATYATSGDYYVWTILDDGAGSSIFQAEYLFDNIYWSKDELTNSATGYYDLEYEYDDMSGSPGAYYYSEDKEADPLSGYYDQESTWFIDKDGDGSYYDDWLKWTWNVYDPGTGEGSVGSQLYDYVNGWNQYDDYDYNNITGYYDIEKNYYWDFQLNGTWTDDYYTQYYESYDPYTGNYYKSDDIYDYDKAVYDAATYYNYDYWENLLTGDYRETIDAKGDLDGDGSWNDYSATGSDVGAYRTYSMKDLSTYDNYYESRDQTWNVTTNVYTNNYYEEYLGTGYTYAYMEYQFDLDQDGSYGDDYYSYGSNETNYYGENYQYFYYYDYVGLISGKPAYYNSSRYENPVTGYFDYSEDYRYDTDGDGSYNDYSSNGAYRYDYEEYYYPYAHEYWYEVQTYTPAAADLSYGFSYEDTWYYAEGDYWEQGYTRRIDADGDDSYNDYSGADFGGAYYYDTYSEYDPDEYDYLYTETDIYDPWGNYQQNSYYEIYTDPVNPGTPFEEYSYTDLYLDTDDDNVCDNYYSYSESYSDQYYGDGYNYNEYYWYNYDSGEYQYNSAESYATGSFYNEFEYAADTDADGNIEDWEGDDYYVYNESGYDADTGEAWSYEWTSEDYDNNRGAFRYSMVDNWSYLSGTYENVTEYADLNGVVRTWSGYEAGCGRTYDGTGTAYWGYSAAGVENYWYDGGDYGVTYTNYVDSDGDTLGTVWRPWYDIESQDWETAVENFDVYEDAWHWVGYDARDLVTGDRTAYEKGTSANCVFEQFQWLYDGTSGDYREISRFYTSGVPDYTFAKDEWWRGAYTWEPWWHSDELYIYTAEAGGWYPNYIY